MIDRAAVVLPQPLSPASPRLSPSPRVKSTPSTARTVPSWVWKCVSRPFTVKSRMLPLRGMGRTNPGTRFSERGSRTQGSALTFCLMHTPVRAHRIRGMGLSRSTKSVASSDLKTRVRRFYAYQTASSFAIWIPFWALWIRGHLSSDFEFTVVDVAFWVGLLVFQLPVGVVGDLRLTLLVGAILNLGAVGVAVTFREPKVERTPESTYVEQLVQGLRVVRRREGVALLIGVEVFLGVTLYVMAVFRPLYLQALGLSESAIAISIGGFLLVPAIWSAFAGTITRVLGIFLGIVTFFPCAYILARWRTTVAAWPAVTPLPSRLIAGSRVSRFHRLLERMSRLRP